jgi:hypothetical protein
MQRDGMHNRTFEGKRERSGLVTLVLGLGIILAPFDVTVVVVALPGIAKNLDFSVGGAPGSSTHTAWLSQALSLLRARLRTASGGAAFDARLQRRVSPGFNRVWRGGERPDAPGCASRAALLLLPPKSQSNRAPEAWRSRGIENGYFPVLLL